MILEFLDDENHIDIYVDIVPYEYTNELIEDVIDDDHVFEKDHVYQNELDTRWYILTEYITKISDEISNFPYVSECNPRPSNAKTGLYNYIDITFIHPDFVTEEELESNYIYTIRFSEHKDEHPEYKHTEKVEMVGMKAKNLKKAAMKVLKARISQIQRDIAKFEVDTYGEQLTFFEV